MEEWATFNQRLSRDFHARGTRQIVGRDDVRREIVEAKQRKKGR